MRKIAVALSKGGVGKTTTAVNLAAGLALSGRRVLLIDVDTQGQAAKLLGCAPAVGLAEVAGGEAAAQQAVTAAREHLDLLAGGRGWQRSSASSRARTSAASRRIAEALAPLDGRYDFAILDTAPGWDALSVNALFYATEVLTPVSLEIMTLQSLLDFNQSLAAIQRYHPDLALRYIVPTFFDRRVRKSDEILGQLAAHFGRGYASRSATTCGCLKRPGTGRRSSSTRRIRPAPRITGR